MKLPLDEIHEFATAILSENHALYPDMLQSGILGFLEHESLSAAEKAMRDYLKKERRFQRGLVPLHEGIESAAEDEYFSRLGFLTKEALCEELFRLRDYFAPDEKLVLELRIETYPAIPRRLIAKRLGITPRQVELLEERILKRLKECLREM